MLVQLGQRRAQVRFPGCFVVCDAYGVELRKPAGQHCKKQCLGELAIHAAQACCMLISGVSTGLRSAFPLDLEK
jgi:hypothetical protein